MKPPAFTLNLGEAGKGVNIGWAAEEALRAANALNVYVTFVFNDLLINAGPNDNVDRVVDEYWRAHEARKRRQGVSSESPTYAMS